MVDYEEQQHSPDSTEVMVSVESYIPSSFMPDAGDMFIFSLLSIAFDLSSRAPRLDLVDCFFYGCHQQVNVRQSKCGGNRRRIADSGGKVETSHNIVYHETDIMFCLRGRLQIAF